MKEKLKNIKVGNTPLVELKNIEAKYGLKSKVFAKVESYNPAGSIKDRIAYQMILDAIEEGKIDEKTTLIEPTSGNTGIAIAYIARELGLKCILTMPESMSLERRRILASYGATLELTPAGEGMKGAIAKANELNVSIKNSLILGQFDNMSNPKAHYLTTGPEIYSQTKGNVDILIAGVGTGGTISGTTKYLKEKKSILSVAVEPSTSAVLSGNAPGKHRIQGIGAGFVPNTFDRSVVDEIEQVETSEAMKMALELKEVENLGVGVSAGAAVVAAIKKAKELEGKNIVVILPDGNDRYRPEDYQM